MTEEINSYNHNNNNNDDASYVGFHNVATMPYHLSDMTTVIYDIDFIDQQGPRVYLVGGCIEDQDCSAGLTKCICPDTTDKCIYFTPEVYITR